MADNYPATYPDTYPDDNVQVSSNAGAATFEAYGRIDGQVVYHYGPKSFYPDWGGAFTALEVANILTKLPKVSVGKRTPIKIRRSGKIAEAVNALAWLERLESCTFDVDYLAINGTKGKRSIDEILPSQLLKLSTFNDRPSKLVADALIKMGVNKWGVVQQVTIALCEFDLKKKTGIRGLSCFVTI